MRITKEAIFAAGPCLRESSVLSVLSIESTAGLASGGERKICQLAALGSLSAFLG